MMRRHKRRKFPQSRHIRIRRRTILQQNAQTALCQTRTSTPPSRMRMWRTLSRCGSKIVIVIVILRVVLRKEEER